MKIKYKIASSKVHGNGVFATTAITQGEMIGVVVVINRMMPEITQDFGRYVNHSINANCRLQHSQGKYFAVATRNIKAGEEILGDYNDTPFFLEKPRADFV